MSPPKLGPPHLQDAEAVTHSAGDAEEPTAYTPRKPGKGLGMVMSQVCDNTCSGRVRLKRPERRSELGADLFLLDFGSVPCEGAYFPGYVSLPGDTRVGERARGSFTSRAARVRIVGTRLSLVCGKPRAGNFTGGVTPSRSGGPEQRTGLLRPCRM